MIKKSYLKFTTFPTGDYSVFFMKYVLSNKDLSDEFKGQSPVGKIVNFAIKTCCHRLYTGYKGRRIIGVSEIRHKQRIRPFCTYWCRTHFSWFPVHGRTGDWSCAFWSFSRSAWNIWWFLVFLSLQFLKTHLVKMKRLDRLIVNICGYYILNYVRLSNCIIYYWTYIMHSVGIFAFHVHDDSSKKLFTELSLVLMRNSTTGLT